MVGVSQLFANVRVMMIVVETAALIVHVTQELAKMSKHAPVKRNAVETKSVEMGFCYLVGKASLNVAVIRSITIVMGKPTKIAHVPTDKSDRAPTNVAVVKKSAPMDSSVIVPRPSHDRRFAVMKSMKTAMVNSMTAVDVRWRERCACV